MTGAVLPFTGSVQGTLDAKGRVCIPASYRQILAAQNTAGVYICPSFTEQALEAFGNEVLQAFQQRLSQLDPFFSATHDDQAFAVMASSQLLTLDEQGRVRLPDAMIEHAGLKDRVAFAGLNGKFQIWEPEAFKARLSISIQNARGLRVNAPGGAVG